MILGCFINSKSNILILNNLISLRILFPSTRSWKALITFLIATLLFSLLSRADETHP